MRYVPILGQLGFSLTIVTPLDLSVDGAYNEESAYERKNNKE